jgi:adenylosuccinate lyase
MAAVQAGGDRQALHEVIRTHSLAAWAALQTGQPNPLTDLLAADSQITQFVPADGVLVLLDASEHVGDAAERAQAMAALLRTFLTPTQGHGTL